MSLIKVNDLHKEYRNEEIVTEVLKGLTFEIEKGEFLAIMGPSGSGKSTLMHLLGFLDRPTSGKYWFENKDVTKFSQEQLADIRNQKVGFIFQAFYLLPRVSVYENVKLPLIYSKKVKNADNQVKAAIESVGLTHRINNLSNQLSGGEKQRVAIARALVNQPELIFADEPTGNLDSKTGLEIMKIFEELNEAGKTIILVTHEKYTAEHARRILNLRDGVLIKDETVKNRRLANHEKELLK